MLKLTSPAKACIILFFLTVGVFEYGLKDTALTLAVLIGGMILYNWWVKNYTI